LDSQNIVRATDSFHSHSVYDFIQVGTPPDEFYGQLLLIFEFTDRDGWIHSLAWIRHLKKIKKSKIYERWMLETENTLQVIRVLWIKKKLSLVVDVSKEDSFYLLE
jgi:hypothetical protein